MKRRIVLLGPPAAGKGTQAEKIQAKYGIPVASPGAILREERKRGTELGVHAETLTAQGKLLPDSIIGELVSDWLKGHVEAFAFDGFPRSMGQATLLEALLRKLDASLDVVLALEADEPTLLSRVLSRLVCDSCGRNFSVGLHLEAGATICPVCGGQLVRRVDDTPDILQARLEEYREKTLPLVSFYESSGLIRKIDSTQPPDVVFASVQAILDQA